MELRRGDIYYADLNPVIGSEQGGVRPVLILQSDIGNRYSPTTIIAAITSRNHKAKQPTHVELPTAQSNLPQDSVALLEQLRTIDKQRLTEKVSLLDSSTMEQVDKALEISLGLTGI